MSVTIWQWRWLPCLNIKLFYCVLAKLKVQHFLLIHHSVWAKSDRCLLVSHPFHILRWGSKNPYEKWKFANTWWHTPPKIPNVFYNFFFFLAFSFSMKKYYDGELRPLSFYPHPAPWTSWGMAWRLVQVVGQFWCSYPLKGLCIFILGATLHICETMKYEATKSKGGYTGIRCTW
jgi:hypothetical protein